ncbi:MAG: tetratricopeptide repeat protein [bacterium]|nr:tetratricopeptide repeat protein [bacterium]
MKTNRCLIATRCLIACIIVLSLGPGLLQPRSPAVAQEGEAVPDPAVRQALEKLRQDDVEGAIALLEPLHANSTATPLVLATLGALYLEIGLPGDALEVLRPLADRGDANPAVLFNAGRAALELGEAAAGEQYLERSVRMQPVSLAARTLGLRYGSRGQTAAAYQLLGPWALANPDDSEARLAAAAAALKLERPDEAAELLEALPLRGNPSLVPLRGNPSLVPLRGNPRVGLLRAELALQRGEPEAALALLEPLAASHPPEMRIDVLVLRASALIESGRPAAAVDLLAGRADSHPRLALSLARAHAAAGDPEGEQAALEALRELVPATPDAGPERQPAAPASDPLAPALALIDRGRSDEALAVIREAISRAPNDLRARLLEVRTLVQLGRAPEAREKVEAAIAIFPDHPDALQFGAVVKMALGANEEAERDLRRILEIEPEYVPAMCDLAFLLGQRGETAEARRLLQRILERHPDDPLARARLRDLEATED